MSEFLFSFAQAIITIWPLFILTAMAYAFQGRMTWNAFSRRMRQSLLSTWTVLFFVWLFTLFAPGPNLGLIPEPWNTLAFLGGFGLLLFGEASRLGLLRRRLRARVEMRHTHTLQRLKNLDPYDFENLVAETYQSLGFYARQVGHSGDHGVDVKLIAPDGKSWVVQCKRYSGTVGESIIRELYGTMVSEKAHRAVLVTTAQITAPAREWARGKPIDLVDGPDFLKMMEEAQRRSQGSLLERISIWFENLLEPAPPSGLRPQMHTTPDLSATQPVRARPPLAIQYAGDAPVCPNCRLPMVPRPTNGANGTAHAARVLYRCRNYPRCRVVLESQR